MTKQKLVLLLFFSSWVGHSLVNRYQTLRSRSLASLHNFTNITMLFNNKKKSCNNSNHSICGTVTFNIYYFYKSSKIILTL